MHARYNTTARHRRRTERERCLALLLLSSPKSQTRMEQEFPLRGITFASNSRMGLWGDASVGDTSGYLGSNHSLVSSRPIDIRTNYLFRDWALWRVSYPDTVIYSLQPGSKTSPSFHDGVRGDVGATKLRPCLADADHSIRRQRVSLWSERHDRPPAPRALPHA